LPPMIVGPIFFAAYLPHRWQTGPLFALSLLLATVACFACRFLVNATGYWLLDIRGSLIAWVVGAGVLGGLYFPIRFLPDDLAVAVWVLTPTAATDDAVDGTGAVDSSDAQTKGEAR